MRDPVEAELLAAVVRGDPGSGPVYADWLEQQGDLVRAEFLRVQDAVIGVRPDRKDDELATQTSRLRALSAQIELAWRLLVASPAVERCSAFDFQCPMEWSMLRPTSRADVRHCGACEQDVYYSLNIREARTHAQAGRCVALDVLSARWDDDLAEPFGVRICARCKGDLGPRHGPMVTCPHCNYAPSAGVRGRVTTTTLPADQIRV